MILLWSICAKESSAEEGEANRVEAQRLFQEGVEAARERDFTRAIDRFSESYELFPHPGTLLNLGLYQIEAGRRVDAFKTLGQLINSHNAVISEEARREVTERLRELESTLATVTVDTRPQGALIVINDEERGRTPMSDPLILEPGSYVIEARLDGFETTRATYELQPGSNPLIELELEPSSLGLPAPQLQVDCSVEGARISLDDGVPVPAPLRVDVQTGPHEVRVEALGHMTQTRHVEIPAAGIVHLVVDLVPLTASVQQPELIDPEEGTTVPDEPGGSSRRSGRRRVWPWVVTAVVLGGAIAGVSAAVVATREEADWVMRLP